MQGKLSLKYALHCYKCGGWAKPAKLRFQSYDIGGWKCKCGEEYFEPMQAQRILLLNKLQKQAVSATLGQIRSNLILRLPKQIQEAMHLKKGEEVRLRLLDSRRLEIAV